MDAEIHGTTALDAAELRRIEGGDLMGDLIRAAAAAALREAAEALRRLAQPQ